MSQNSLLGFVTEFPGRSCKVIMHSNHHSSVHNSFKKSTRILMIIMSSSFQLHKVSFTLFAFQYKEVLLRIHLQTVDIQKNKLIKNIENSQFVSTVRIKLFFRFSSIINLQDVEGGGNKIKYINFVFKSLFGPLIDTHIDVS